jgi:C-terminal processing protease CtpA/Prc
LEINKFLGVYDIPFKLTKIGDKYIVDRFYCDSLAKLYNIKYGDIIFKIDSMDIDQLVRNREPYIGGSNDRSIIRNILWDITCNIKDEPAKITLGRNNDTIVEYVNRYHLTQLYELEIIQQSNQRKFIKYCCNIGYLNLGNLDTSDIENLKNDIHNSSGLIIDIRDNSNNTLYLLSKLLNPIKIDFAQFFSVNPSFPGCFKFTNTYSAGPNKFSKDYYKGFVCLLVNEYTQSHGEFTTMALQTAPNVITIGSQTAGADGDVSCFPLPGGITTCFSGVGVYYPDLTPTQRKGIRIDYEVKPTIEGIRKEKDEILEYAIDFIKSKL